MKTISELKQMTKTISISQRAQHCKIREVLTGILDLLDSIGVVPETEKPIKPETKTETKTLSPELVKALKKEDN